jgi:hypothetical protein
MYLVEELKTTIQPVEQEVLTLMVQFKEILQIKNCQQMEQTPIPGLKMAIPEAAQ